MSGKKSVTSVTGNTFGNKRKNVTDVTGNALVTPVMCYQCYHSPFRGW